MTGLDTRLNPGIRRPITFDPAAAKDRTDIALVHLGHPIVSKAQRLLRRSLWSADSPLHRITAVVVEDLPESFVAAVTRMVLVGRGGLRLHEEVFLAGVRLRGRRAMAEDKAEDALNIALDAGGLTLANEEVRRALADYWNAPDAAVRSRLLESMEARSGRRHVAVAAQLGRRETAETQRAGEIFAAFRVNLRDSLAELRTKQEEEAAMLWADDQQRQWRRDIEAMQQRLDELDDEEQREVAAVRERYRDIKPHTSAAAVVFALTPEDAEAWSATSIPPATSRRCHMSAMRRASKNTRGRPSSPSAVEMHRAWLELVETEGPFLAVPALKRGLGPEGMPPLASDRKRCPR